MKIIKYILFLLMIIFVGGSIFFGTKDGSFDVSDSKIIKAPIEVIYNNVNDYKNWQVWGPWMKIDSNIVIHYSEKTIGEGASYSWSSDHRDVGNGSMETMAAIPYEKIDQKIRFHSPLGDSESNVYWNFEKTEISGESKVTWGMKGEHSFMEKVIMSFQEKDMETGLHEMFLSGLSNLEEVVLDEMNSFIITVDGISLYEGRYYLYSSSASKQNEIGDKMGAMLGEVMMFMKQNNIDMAGVPFTIFNEIDTLNGTVIFSAGIPVKERIITPSGSPILCGYLKQMPTLKTTLKGNYNFLPRAYEKANQYILENNILKDPLSKMFEVYSTDPGIVTNPAEWTTEIYIPIITATTIEN